MAVLQLAIIWPAVLLLIGLVVQFGTWMNARHVAQAAVSRGLEKARVEGGTLAAGESEAQYVLRELAPSILLDPSVDVSRTAAGIRVEIRGTAQSVIPGLALPVDIISVGPPEQIPAAVP